MNGSGLASWCTWTSRSSGVLFAPAIEFPALGAIRGERVITDNGSAYRSRPFRKTCRWLGIAAKRPRPYRPQTNGKAERMIQTLLRKWAYAVAYATSEHRRAALKTWLRFYNEE